MTSLISTLEMRLLRFRSSGLLVLDVGSWFMALAFATVVRLQLIGSGVAWTRLGLLALSAGVLQVSVAGFLLRSLGVNRIGTFGDVVTVFRAWFLVAPAVVTINYLVLDRPVPTSALITALPLSLSAMFGGRFLWRMVMDQYRRARGQLGSERVLVFGAGQGGEQIIRAMFADKDSNYYPVGLLDDSPVKANREISGLRVLGNRDVIAQVAAETDATVLLIAIPSADSVLVGELDDLAREAGLSVRVLPGTSELLGLLHTDDIRELTEADLLGRAEVSVDLDSIVGYITGKRVLVTGAGGSIGSELCRQLHRLAPAELYMLDRDETALHGVQLSIEGKALLDTPNLIVADIRDQKRIDELFALHKPDVVFHTAALKHLTLLENHPEEGFKTNVAGTNNLLEAALENHVERFVNVSTDKAADPTSVLGRTKLMAERLTARAANRNSGTYVSVRFGNVLGSRGSVLPTFRRQIENGGPITVTHPDVTRYFMTIPEAVSLVLQSGAIGQPGEIMILDMGEPVKIVDLAKRLIAHSGTTVDIQYTGLRPGEKLHEILVAGSEIGNIREHPRIMHASGQAAGVDPASDAALSGGLTISTLP